MTGWHGKILIVDLQTQSSKTIYPELEIYTKFIGGKGLAGYFLRNHITKMWDHENMPLIFMTGPLNNTASPTSGRMTIMSRSPLTGTVGDTSVGGSLGYQIKKAGFDGIIIQGKSDSLIGIELEDDRITFKEAHIFKGQIISVVHEQLRKKGATVIIGPAAENAVLFAGIAIDQHYFSGRNGLGAVMAAKNLKYITIQGSHKTQIADSASLKNAREDIFRLVAASPVLMGELGITHFGTGALYDLMDSRHMMPTRNFNETHYLPAQKMNAFHYQQKYKPKKIGCRGCHILCKKRTAEGNHLPEFETMSHFSALLLNEDIDLVRIANEFCNEMGMDTISAAVTLACYAEINNSIFSPIDILHHLEDIAYSRNEGVFLKLGSFRYAKMQGRPECSITVKGQELPAYDPRGAYGMALAYATSTRGGCHLRAYPISHEILRKPVVTNRFSFSGKARIIKIAEDMNAIIDSLTACKFIFFGASLEEFAHAFTAVTGIESSAQELLHIGERIYYHERMMNAANGFDVSDDDLPERFFKQAGSSGNSIKIPPLNRTDFLKARSDYYKIRGLSEQGKPLEKKAEELGLL